MDASYTQGAGVEGAEHRFLELSSARVHVVQVGHGSPVLLLHGFPQNWHQYRSIIPALAAEHTVFVLDFPGAGRSTALAGRYDKPALLGVLDELVDALKLDRFDLIAHDYAALLGFQYALRSPERLTSFTSLAIPPPYFAANRQLLGRVMVHGWFEMVLPLPGVAAALLSRGRQPLARTLFDSPQGRQNIWSEAELERYLQPLRERSNARAASRLYRHFILPEAMRAMTGRYRGQKLNVRTLVLLGRQDAVLDPSLLHWKQELTPRLSYRTVDRAGHFLLEEQPRVVREEILHFLAGGVGPDL